MNSAAAWIFSNRPASSQPLQRLTGGSVRAGAVGDLRRHADALAQRRMRMDGLADVHLVGAHLDRQRDLADHVAGVGADDAAADDAVGLRVEQQLGEAFVAAVGDRPAGGGPGEHGPS